MKSEVELTPGFSRSMRTTEMPVVFAITAYVSPARTTQNRGVEVFPVVAATARGGRCRTAAGLEAGADQDDRDRRGEQERRRCRVVLPASPHYQPEAAQTSRWRRAASAPAALRKSSPELRNA